MTTAPVSGIIQPEISDVLQNLKLDIFSTLNCCMPGIIQSFDADACTAVVLPVFNRLLPNGTIAVRKPINDCPVFFPGGGGGRLTFPVAQGDQCFILFADRRLDEWVDSGAQGLPGDPRMHDLSDGIVLVGLDPTGALGPVAANMVELSYQGSKFQLTSTGWNFVGEGGAEIDLSGDTVTIKNGNAEIDLVTGIVTIKNGTTTLNTLIQALCTALEALTVTVSGSTGVISAASIAAIQAVATEIAGLLG